MWRLVGPSLPGAVIARMVFPRTLKGAVMTDDLKNCGAQDRARVNVNEAHEVQLDTRTRCV